MASHRTNLVPASMSTEPELWGRQDDTDPSRDHRTRRPSHGAWTEDKRSRFAGGGHTFPQPKTTSRIPMTSTSHRRPSNERSDRPPLTHQTQPVRGLKDAAAPRSVTHPAVASSRTGNLPLATSAGQPRKVLRRKHSNLSQEAASLRNDSRNDSNRTSSSSSNPRSQASLDTSPGVHLDRGITKSPMEIRVAQKVELPKTTAQPVTIYPELDRYRDFNPPMPSDHSGIDVPYRIATHDLPPPTPLFSEISALSGSPSTRFSGSPGPGPYSRDTTPTSISSQSPGLFAPARLPIPRARPQPTGETKTRPPVTRRRAGSISNEDDSLGADPHGLAAVRESLNSSSSNSTVRDAERKDSVKRKKTRLSPPPPSPPPRKSSQKFNKSRDEESPSQASRPPAQSVVTSPSSGRATQSSSHGPSAQPSPQPSHAGLAVASPKATPPARPRRPSRDGTPDLHSQFGLPLPVIQSNLSSTSLSERRYSQTLPTSSLGRSITPSSLPDRQPPLSRLPHGPVSAPDPANGTVAAKGESANRPEPGGSTRTPSPSVSGFKSRFPIFGRRNKTAPDAAHQDKKDKTPRKGPSAGTGHEGYGRLGAVRRRSSSTSRGVYGVVSSQESLSGGPSHDPFLADRIAPVVIAGGEVIENRNTSSELSRAGSNLSIPFGRPADLRSDSQLSLSSQEGPRQTLWPSALPREPSQLRGPRDRRPSDSSDSEILTMRPTLAYRRSMQRLKNSEQTPKMPKPIVTRGEVVSSAMTSIDESIMSDDSLFVPQTAFARDRRGSDAKDTAAGSKKLTKRTRSPRKWNFFGRSQSQPASAPKKDQKADNSKTVAATVKVVQQKPMAYYTMMDSSEQEDVDNLNIEEVVREARRFEPAEVRTQTERKPSVGRGQGVQQERRLSVTQPSPRDRRPSVTQQSRDKRPVESSHLNPQEFSHRRNITAPAAAVASSSSIPPPPQLEAASQPRQVVGRPSRLPQVGRIPKVVTARPEHASPKSFSRPFNRISVHLEPPKPGFFQDTESLAKGPSPPRPSTPELTQDESTVTSGTNASGVRLSQDAGRTYREFLSFSPRNNSLGTVTTTTSSSSGMLIYAGSTAVVPPPNAPLAEDEIWDEYNDILGEDTLLKPPQSVGDSVARILRGANPGIKLARPIDPPLESPTIFVPPVVQSLDEALRPSPEPDRAAPTSSLYSADAAEKVKEFLDLGLEPPTPFSVSEFVGGYGDRNNSIASLEEETRRPTEEISDPSDRGFRRSNASGSSQGSEDDSPLSQVNLRVGSMTVSKWLTFGHVLFSPLRDELNEISVGSSLKRPSILVIDGLGNDDWSFYAAETYPAANFFNLSPRAPLPAGHQSSSTIPLSPSNHHQIQYTTLAAKFPFGPDSFTSVVFRFPAAAPEAQYRNIISEARRVLKPGGFIEMSILDVDLNNMGNRGRRAVRRLKEQIHARAPDTSLGSTSDLILRLLGRKGFSDIKTCRVGVPVASPIARSSGSEKGARLGKATAERHGLKTAKVDRSLADMMSDESPVADENITKMVAKVGRWWYGRCYETAAAPASGPGLGPKTNSLWVDRALLAECEEWGTSLKLMVCHARVPDGRGRLASI